MAHIAIKSRNSGCRIVHSRGVREERFKAGGRIVVRSVRLKRARAGSGVGVTAVVVNKSLKTCGGVVIAVVVAKERSETDRDIASARIDKRQRLLAIGRVLHATNCGRIRGRPCHRQRREPAERERDEDNAWDVTDYRE